jgi:L-aspartate oxidase
LNSKENIVLNASTDDEFLTIKNELSVIMTNQVGIVRNGQDLKKAINSIESILQKYKGGSNDYNIKKIVDLATVCKLISLSALKREESRGGHVRSDFQSERDSFICHHIQEKGKDLVVEKVRK